MRPVRLLLACALACVLVCTLPATAQEDDGSSQIKYLHEHQPKDREPWARALAGLAQRIVSLPFEPASAARALELIRAHRSGPLGAATEWAFQVPRVRITAAEARTFPDSLALQQSRPWFRASDPGGLGALDLSAEESGDDEETEADDGIDEDRPRLFRPSLLHVLALRGFPDAAAAVLEFVAANATASREAPEQAKRDALAAGCTLGATLRIAGVTPLHLLSIYAPDEPADSTATATSDISVSASDSGDNVRTAQLMMAAGANCSAHVEVPEGVTPLVLAGERGHENLLRYFLSQRLRPSFGAHWATLTRTLDEQTALGEWAAHRQRIVDRDVEGMPRDDGTDVDEQWVDYLHCLAAELFKTLQLSVVSNRLGVVRMLLSTPAYGLSSRLNERAHGGKGDAVLHGAVVHGLVEMASLLIDRGADVAMRSYDGLTALQLAQQYERRDMAAMIEKRLKEVRPPPRGARPPEQQKPQQQEAKPAASKSKYQQAKDNKRQKKQQQQQAASAAATAQATGRRSSQHDEL